MQNVVLQELGAGNVAAATKIYDTYFAGESDTLDARSLVALVDKLDPGLVNDLVSKALDQIAKSAVRAIPQVAF